MGLPLKAVHWTAPVGLPPPHKLGIRPPSQFDAKSKGRLQANEILGKSNFSPTISFQLPRSIEGISPGTTSACDDMAKEDSGTKESSMTSNEDAATSFVLTPSTSNGNSVTCFVRTPTTCFVQFPSAYEGESPSAKDGIPLDYEGKRPSATDGNVTCFVQIPSTDEGKRPSASDGNATCLVQIPSTDEGKSPSTTDGNQTTSKIGSDDGSHTTSLTKKRNSSAHENSYRVWPIDLVDRVRTILQLPIRQPSKPEFSFELTMESAEKNFSILTKKYGGSLKAALEGQHESPLGMGSEFRPI